MPITLNGSVGATTGNVTLTGTGVPANGMNLVAANAVGLYTNNTERARIDSSGNLLVGTSSPTFIAGTGLAVVRAGGSATIQVTRSDASTAGGLALIGGSTQNVIESAGAKPLTFEVNSAERMRVDSAGKLLLGTATPFAGAGARQSILFTSNTEQGLVFKTSSSTFTGGPILFRNNADGTSGSITQSQTTISYNTSSDYRLKHDIKPMTGALAKVALLKPCTYKWNFDNSENQGFIAHELQAVVPECVAGEKDAVDAEGNPVHQGVDTSFLVATLTAAIQEQQAIITALTARITALEAA